MAEYIEREAALSEARPEYLNETQIGHEEKNKAYNAGKRVLRQM